MLLSEVGMATASRSGRKKRGTNLDRALDQRFARYGLTRSDAPRWDPAPLENARYQPCSGRGGLLAPAKFAAIAPHPVQDDSELARHCYPGTLEALALGQADAPGLEVGPARGTGQDHGCGLIEQCAHHGVAGSGDVARAVDLAGLV